jgi:uncharacterized radical SAM superfamily protein
VSKIAFVRPTNTISISVTGSHCALNCLHCAGNYLEGKVDVHDLDGLPDASSYLITGGCDSEGKVPILEHVNELSSLSKDPTKIGHTGLVDEHEVEELANLIDVASFDFVSDDDTIRDIFGLYKTASDFIKSYSRLLRRIPTFPHITIGLNRGRLSGELEALDLLSGFGTQSVVLNVFIPTNGTQLQDVPPPSLLDVRKVIERARGSFDDVYLGCMRPGGRYREDLDIMALEEGVDRIVNPSKPSRELAVEKGLDIEWREECCVL